MKTQRVLIILTVINLAMLVANLAQSSSISAQGPAAVLRGRALEIVDAQGRVRASIGVMPAERPATGEPYPETVLFRLITERGRPSVKLGASEQSSGMSLSGPSETHNTFVTISAKGAATSMRMKDENGREQMIAP
jgi:hypothetical protein